MTTPIISIIVPTYNSERDMQVFLESFTHSTFRAFEIIVNDDPRTTDGTADLCETFRARGLDITYLCENITRAQGRKRGSEYAK